MNKKENARKLGDKRFVAEAKSMSVVPGGPENNNPMNVNDIATPAIKAQSIYNDYPQNYAQMGTGMVNPMATGPSGLQQNFPMGQGKNRIPFGLQQQPNTAGAAMDTDGMEAGRQAQAAQQRGLFAGPMGMMGQPVVQGNVGENPAFSGPPMMQGMPSAEQAAGKGMNTRTGKRGK